MTRSAFIFYQIRFFFSLSIHRVLSNRWRYFSLTAALHAHVCRTGRYRCSFNGASECNSDDARCCFGFPSKKRKKNTQKQQANEWNFHWQINEFTSGWIKRRLFSFASSLLFSHIFLPATCQHLFLGFANWTNCANRILYVICNQNSVKCDFGNRWQFLSDAQKRQTVFLTKIKSPKKRTQKWTNEKQHNWNAKITMRINEISNEHRKQSERKTRNSCLQLSWLALSSSTVWICHRLFSLPTHLRHVRNYKIKSTKKTKKKTTKNKRKNSLLVFLFCFVFIESKCKHPTKALNILAWNS